MVFSARLMNGCSSIPALGVALALLLAPRGAGALQTLDEFLASSRTRSLDAREAVEVAAQRSGEVDQAWGRVLPGVTARGSYTRNQYETSFTLPPAGPGAAPETTTITPYNQLDAFVTLDVPLIDVAGWYRVGAASAAAEAARVRTTVTDREVERAITEYYFGVLAAEAMADAAQRTLATAEQNRNIVAARQAAGAATQLDVERAQVEIEQARQNLANAELARAVNRKGLESVTGLVPTQGSQPLVDDLAEEAPLAVWTSTDLSTRAPVRASALDRKAADRTADAAVAAFVPVVSAQATERYSNAAGFSGQNASWAASVIATWRLDFAMVGALRAQNAGERAASVREEKAKLASSDRIHNAWHSVRAQIAKARAARAQVKASEHAARLARDRYQNGAGTQLELITADRDAFAAEVGRIQADANLAYARALLRLSAGRPIRRAATPTTPAAAPTP